MNKINKEYCIKMRKTNSRHPLERFLYKGFSFEKAIKFYKRQAQPKVRGPKYYCHISKYKDGRWDGFGTTKRENKFQY